MAFGIFSLITLLFFFFNVYHLAKFGLENTKTYLLISVYFFCFFGLIIFWGVAFSTIDWNHKIDIASLFGNVFSFNVFGTTTKL